MNSRRLNLGCGADYRPGYLNVDHPRAVTRKDLAVDLDATPWPFASGSAGEILMQDSLEHLTFPDQKIMEVHRVLRPGGVFWGGVPYAHSDGAVQALEHRCFFTEKSFDYLCGVSGYDALTAGRGALFLMEYVRLTTYDGTRMTRFRNLVPFRGLLRHFLRNMYDGVAFKLIKL